MTNQQMTRIFSALKIAQPSVQFCEALEYDSSSELDWLWYADHTPSNRESIYCLERAYAIKPRPQILQRLKRLEAFMLKKTEKQNPMIAQLFEKSLA